MVLSARSVIGVEDLPEIITSSSRGAAIRVEEIMPLKEAHQLVEDLLMEMARENTPPPPR